MKFFILKFSIFIGIYLLTAGCYTNNPLEVKVNSQNLPPLEVPKIYKGQDFLYKQEIFKYEKTKKEKEVLYGMAAPEKGERPSKIDQDEFQLNDIRQIFAGELDNVKGTDILAAGRKKAFILDIQGKVKKVIDYKLGSYRDDLKQDYDLPFISIVDLNNDGKVEIAGHGIRICLILDLNGKIVWKYKKIGKGEGISIDEMEVADVNGDGENEVIITKNESFEILNIDGMLRVEKQLNKWRDGNRLKITDFNKDGRNEIFIGKTIYDGNGEIINHLKVMYFTDVINYNGTFLLKFENNNLKFLDSKGNIVKSLNAPLSSLQRKTRYSSGGYVLFEMKTKEIRLKKDEANHLAVLVSANDEEEFDNFHILYVYDSQGNLVFQETIQSFTSEMTILPNDDGTESLLVTDDGKINLYTIK